MIGEVVSHYVILEKAGSGGMGVVYKAEDLRLHRVVALKFLPEHLTGDPSFAARLRQEAQAASALNHPNICTIYDVGEENGRAFIAMEHLAGSTLRERISAGPLSLNSHLTLAIDIAAGLEAAHSAGVIHRDIKPANIFVLANEHAKILDFGLAKMLPSARANQASGNGSHSSNGHHRTDSALVVGTVAYMSPEQARGEGLDERSDLFSFGCVLYEMATGTLPFSGATAAVIFDAILNRQPVPPRVINPDLPPGLEDAILRLLAKDRNSRYQHASEIRAELKALMLSTKMSAQGQDAEKVSVATASASEVPISGQAPAGPHPPLTEDPHFFQTTIEIPRWPSARWKKTLAFLIVIVVAIGLILSAGIAGHLRRDRERSAVVTPGTASVVVLPFADLSPNKDEEYFSDGLTVQLINELAMVREIRVVGRSSAFQFKGKNEDLRVVGQKLGVDHVLEGSVRREGNRLRISAELIKTSDGFQLWSETYDRKLSDIFAVQDEIARAATTALKVRLLDPSRSHVGILLPTNDSAYQAYLQGEYFTGQGQGEEEMRKALEYTNQAITLDAKYAPAWAQRSHILSSMGTSAIMDNNEAFRQARHDAEQAIAIDRQLSSAYSALAEVQIEDDRDWEGAQASLNKAAELQPGNVNYVNARALLMRSLGRLDEGIELTRHSIAIDPLRARTHARLGDLLYAAGRYDEADVALRKALDLNPKVAVAHASRAKILLAQGHPEQALPEMELEPVEWIKMTGLAMVYHALGRPQDSELALQWLIGTHAGDCAFQVAEVYAYRGERDKAFEWLNRAYNQRDAGLRDVKTNPSMNGLHDDPRFSALLKKMRLAD